jgi:hypothetical protein
VGIQAMGLLIKNSQPVIRLPGGKDAACWRKIYLQRMELLNKIRAAHLRSKLATLQYLPSGGHQAKVSKGHHCHHQRPFSISGSFDLHIVAGYKSHPSSILFGYIIDLCLVCCCPNWWNDSYEKENVKSTGSWHLLDDDCTCGNPNRRTLAKRIFRLGIILHNQSLDNSILAAAKCRL